MHDWNEIPSELAPNHSKYHGLPGVILWQVILENGLVLPEDINQYSESASTIKRRRVSKLDF
jgi:hypothetical protein